LWPTNTGELATWRTIRKSTMSLYWLCLSAGAHVSHLSLLPLQTLLTPLYRLVPGMLVTCAVDKTVTLWDTYQDGKLTSQPPRACANKNMNVGKLYSVGFYPSTPWLLGCAGSGKELALWDMSAEAILQKRFGSRVGAEHVTSSDAPIDEGTKQDDFKAMMTADVKLEGQEQKEEGEEENGPPRG
jgi:WD40 repeat protein